MWPFGQRYFLDTWWNKSLILYMFLSQLIWVEWCIYASKQGLHWSDNGLLPTQRQAIIWTNAGLLWIAPLETFYSEIWINKTIFLQYNEFEYVICKMAAILSRPHCVFVFVFDELYLYLYLIRFLPVYLYLYLYLKLRKKMYLYLYLIKRIWPQPCLSYINFCKIALRSSKFQILFWRLQ